MNDSQEMAPNYASIFWY